ncbi:L,D-transpeptidase family protein [Actinoplanes sp. NPDC051411]|uniref:L,D-transpeptidase family protein n=1 Tax=Actinoplanes sp. NPDC051411 TaxID=3155522 RepID=UPI00343BD4F8
MGAKRAAALAVLVGGLTAAAFAPQSASAAAPSCGTGTYQKQVEGYLAKLGGYGPVTVDGKQSAADCAAIKKFQARFGIRPGTGSADATTYDVGRRLTVTSTAACNAKKTGITFCVDLTHQTTWVMKDGKVYRPPTVTRTGKKGYATPAGTFTINKRTRKEWSDPYHVWLPYWQRFIGGRGFHQTTTYIHDKSIGSHGCVNLLPADAQAYWGIGRMGMTVKVFGRRPGT